MLRHMVRVAADALLRHNAYPHGLTREDALAWYRNMRTRTRALFAIPTQDAYYDRPIDLRNPIVFYEGHIPGFAVNTLIKRTFGKRGIDDELEVLFARGIDPESVSDAKGPGLWPDRQSVRRYIAAADALVEKTLADAPLIEEPVLTILEHELMHQETFLYMLHNLA